VRGSTPAASASTSTPGRTTGTPLGPIPGFTRPPREQRWYRRWWWAILVVVAVVVAAVVSDLPTRQNVQQQATEVGAIVKEIATGVHPCAFAVSEAFKTFFVPARNGTLSSASLGFARQYLDEDQQACSFESTSIFSMSTITVPNSPAGEHITAIIKTVLEWATSDANGAIVDIQTLVRHPTDPTALKDLRKRERTLATDRAKSERDLRAAEADLGGQPLPGLGLPSFPDPSAHQS
jgi:hypothetical protein